MPHSRVELYAGHPATCPPKLNTAQQHQLAGLCTQGEPATELAALFGISRRTAP